MLLSSLFIHMKTYIVYKTVNTLNGKYYYGVHTQSSDKFDGYLGSGKILQEAIKKYGRESFVRETIQKFNTLEEAYDLEAKIVSLEKVLDPNCYNVQIGGLGGAKGTRFLQKDGNGIRVSPESIPTLLEQGWELKGKPRPHSEEWRKKVSERLKGHPVSENTIKKILETKNSRGTTTKGRKLTEEHKKKIREGLSRANKGKQLSPETLQKIKNTRALHGPYKRSQEAIDKAKATLTLHPYHHPEEVRKKISEDRKGWVPSEETRKKISEARKGSIRSQETIEKFKKTAKEKNSFKKSDDWKQKVSKSHKGRKYVHKELEVKVVRPEELETYLSQGWILGKIK